MSRFLVPPAVSSLMVLAVTAFTVGALALGVVARGAPSAAAAPSAWLFQTDPPGTLISPVAGGWTMLVNLGDATAPADVVAGIPSVSALFTHDAATGLFRTFRPGQPFLSDLAMIAPGQAFWLFIEPGRLGGDLYLWEQSATVGPGEVGLEPGFNLVGWTGADGIRVSEAVAALPVRRAYTWVAAEQRFRVWDPATPAAFQDDFPLEYGGTLWLEATSAAIWSQG